MPFRLFGIIRLLLVAAILFMTDAAMAQDALGAVFSGSLVNPKVGAWAWYDLTGPEEQAHFLMRLAIVGSEKLKDKEGYWLEVQVLPTLGYETVYKLLLTGPAKDLANIRKIYLREGSNPVEEVPVSSIASKDDGKGNAVLTDNPEKTLVGTETVKTDGGTLEARHYVMQTDGKTVDLWLNDSIAPMGVVQLKSDQGVLILHNHGVGGPNADSVIDKPSIRQERADSGMKVDMRVEKSGKPIKEKATGKEPKP